MGCTASGAAAPTATAACASGAQRRSSPSFSVRPTPITPSPGVASPPLRPSKFAFHASTSSIPLSNAAVAPSTSSMPGHSSRSVPQHRLPPMVALASPGFRPSAPGRGVSDAASCSTTQSRRSRVGTDESVGVQHSVSHGRGRPAFQSSASNVSVRLDSDTSAARGSSSAGVTHRWISKTMWEQGERCRRCGAESSLSCSNACVSTPPMDAMQGSHSLSPSPAPAMQLWSKPEPDPSAPRAANSAMAQFELAMQIQAMRLRRDQLSQVPTVASPASLMSPGGATEIMDTGDSWCLSPCLTTIQSPVTTILTRTFTVATVDDDLFTRGALPLRPVGPVSWGPQRGRTPPVPPLEVDMDLESTLDTTVSTSDGSDELPESYAHRDHVSGTPTSDFSTAPRFVDGPRIRSRSSSLPPRER